MSFYQSIALRDWNLVCTMHWLRGLQLMSNFSSESILMNTSLSEGMSALHSMVPRSAVLRHAASTQWMLPPGLEVKQLSYQPIIFGCRMEVSYVCFMLVRLLLISCTCYFTNMHGRDKAPHTFAYLLSDNLSGSKVATLQVVMCMRNHDGGRGLRNDPIIPWVVTWESNTLISCKEAE